MTTMKAMLLSALAVLAVSCGDDVPAPVQSSGLAACPAQAIPDHFCPDGRVTCWTDPAVKFMKAFSECTVQVGDPVATVECVESCLVGAAPAITCPDVDKETTVRRCPGPGGVALDANGLELLQSWSDDCIAPWGLPPFVAHRIPECPAQ